MSEKNAKTIYQFANLIDDKQIDEKWAALTENEKARFYECAEVIEADILKEAGK